MECWKLITEEEEVFLLTITPHIRKCRPRCRNQDLRSRSSYHVSVSRRYQQKREIEKTVSDETKVLIRELRNEGTVILSLYAPSLSLPIYLFITRPHYLCLSLPLYLILYNPHPH